LEIGKIWENLFQVLKALLAPNIGIKELCPFPEQCVLNRGGSGFVYADVK
jgi:hypothetical protein